MRGRTALRFVVVCEHTEEELMFAMFTNVCNAPGSYIHLVRPVHYQTGGNQSLDVGALVV